MEEARQFPYRLKSVRVSLPIRMKIKIISIIFVIIVVLNFILMIFNKISTFNFWMIIVLCAIVAYWVIPKLRNKKL